MSRDLTTRLSTLPMATGKRVEVVARGGGLHVPGLNKSMSAFAESDQGAPFLGRIVGLDYTIQELRQSYTLGDADVLRLAQRLLDNKVLLAVPKAPRRPPQNRYQAAHSRLQAIRYESGGIAALRKNP